MTRMKPGWLHISWWSKDDCLWTTRMMSKLNSVPKRLGWTQDDWCKKNVVRPTLPKKCSFGYLFSFPHCSIILLTRVIILVLGSIILAQSSYKIVFWSVWSIVLVQGSIILVTRILILIQGSTILVTRMIILAATSSQTLTECSRYNRILRFCPGSWTRMEPG